MKHLKRKLTILFILATIISFSITAYAYAAKHLMVKVCGGNYTLTKTSGKKSGKKYYTDYAMTIQEGQSGAVQLVWGTTKKATNVTKKVTCKTKGSSIATFKKNGATAYVGAVHAGATMVYTSAYQNNIVRITVNVTCAHNWKNHTTTKKVEDGTERVKVVDKTVYNPVKTFKSYTLRCGCGKLFTFDKSNGDEGTCKRLAVQAWEKHNRESNDGTGIHSYYSDKVDYDTTYVAEEQYHYETRTKYKYVTVVDYVYCTKCGARK